MNDDNESGNNHIFDTEYTDYTDDKDFRGINKFMVINF
jgi:hypothetical protein